MFSWKSLWKPWSGEPNKPPEKDEHMMVSDSLLFEVEFHCKEIEKQKRDVENEERRKKTGVDYSWLISAPVKTYEIPQIERIDLEELCYQVKPSECGKVISLFRDSLLNEPNIVDLPKIMKACIRQVIDQRPKDESLTEWVTKHTASLTQMKLRPQTRIVPVAADSGDIESQISDTQSTRTTVTTLSSVESMSRSHTLPFYAKRSNQTNLPV